MVITITRILYRTKHGTCVQLSNSLFRVSGAQYRIGDVVSQEPDWLLDYLETASQQHAETTFKRRAE